MRSVTSGGQDLEQHVNSEIKRMATVQPSASIANIGNGLEMLGAKIGAIGMKLQERKRAMDADRWQTDLQIRSNNILSNPDNIRAMNAGDYDKVRTELQKMYDDMNAKMETEYGITDKNTQFALGKVRDVLYGNTFASLNVKQVAWEDEKQKGDFTLLMDSKENLLISNMNSGDEVTAEANYQSFLKSNESALRDNLITPDQYQSNLRRIRRIRVTGKAEKMVENAYNNRDINELQRLSVELDHSDYIHKLGGNGDERLGNLANNYLRSLNQELKEEALPKNIRDRAMYTTDVANRTDSEDDTKLAEKANKRFENYLKDPWLASLDANNVSYEGEDYSSIYFSNGNKAVLENYLGTNQFKEEGLDKADDQTVINRLKSIVVDGKTRETLYDRIDYSSDPNLQVGDSVSSLEEMIDIYERKMSFMPYEVRRKAIMDGAKRMGYAEFDVFNHSNMNIGNKYGGMLESIVDYTKPNVSNNNSESDYEVMLRQRKIEDKNFKSNSWQEYGVIFGIGRKYKNDTEYLLGLYDNDIKKNACKDLIKRCDALMVKTNDKDLVQKAYQQGMDMIMGDDVVVEVNDMKFSMNKIYENDVNDIKKKGIELLKTQKVFQYNKGMVSEVKDISNVTNVRGNIYFVPLDENTIQVKHKAFGDLVNEEGEMITINLNDVRSQKVKEKQYQKVMPKGAIRTTGSYF